MAIESRAQTGNNLGFPATVYGPSPGGKYGGAAGTGSGQVYEKVFEWVVDMSDHAVAFDSDMNSTILEGDTIIFADVQVIEELSGGALNVGLVQPDGTGEVADSLIAAFAETAPGQYAVGDGVAIGEPTTADSQLVTSGPTSGIVRIRVKFIPGDLTVADHFEDE